MKRLVIIHDKSITFWSEVKVIRALKVKIVFANNSVKIVVESCDKN